MSTSTEKDIPESVDDPQYTQCAACGNVKKIHVPKCQYCKCPTFVEPGPGEQTCPARMLQKGPWKQVENVDRWDTTHWNQYSDSNRWPEGFEKPRTCSFCGGVHPEDLFRLLDEGWEIENARKQPFKRYVNPPGTHSHRNELVTNLECGPPKHVNPIPPVKLYGYHFSNDELDIFNAINMSDPNTPVM